MILNQGGDVRPGTCFSSQSKGQQKCHGVRKTEIKACLFDVNVLSVILFSTAGALVVVTV